MLAQLHFIFIPLLEMQVCNVILTHPVIFSCIFGVINNIIPNNQLSKCTNTRLKLHKIAYKTSKNRLRLRLCPNPAGGAYFVFYRRTQGRIQGVTSHPPP